jgi:hypothetical protein
MCEMSRKSLILSVVVLMLFGMMLASVGISYAQGGRGNGRGNGPGGPAWDNGNDGDVDTPPYGMGQGQMYGYTEMPRHMYGFHHGMGMNGQVGQNGFGVGPCLECLPAAVEGDVPDDVAAAMMAGLMDEYNAYALYQAVIDQFGEVAPFVNIQAAEAQHIAIHQLMFERYGLEIPEPTVLNPAPVFDNMQAACEMAVDAELANMSLYDDWLITVQNYPDLVQVFTALSNASQYNHLPAFERCANR